MKAEVKRNIGRLLTAKYAYFTQDQVILISMDTNPVSE